jgi:argininosuccinate lyase
MELSEYQKISDLFENDLYDEISLETCIKKRISAGSTGYDSVEKQIQYVTEFINGKKDIY